MISRNIILSEEEEERMMHEIMHPDMKAISRGREFLKDVELISDSDEFDFYREVEGIKSPNEIQKESREVTCCYNAIQRNKIDDIYCNVNIVVNKNDNFELLYKVSGKEIESKYVSQAINQGKSQDTDICAA